MTLGKSLYLSESQFPQLTVPGDPQCPGRTNNLRPGEEVSLLLCQWATMGKVEGASVRLCYPCLGGQSELFFQGWLGQGRAQSRVCMSPHRWSSPRRSCSRTHPMAGSAFCPFPEPRRILGKCGCGGKRPGWNHVGYHLQPGPHGCPRQPTVYHHVTSFIEC